MNRIAAARAQHIGPRFDLPLVPRQLRPVTILSSVTSSPLSETGAISSTTASPPTQPSGVFATNEEEGTVGDRCQATVTLFPTQKQQLQVHVSSSSSKLASTELSTKVSSESCAHVIRDVDGTLLTCEPSGQRCRCCFNASTILPLLFLGGYSDVVCLYELQRHNIKRVLNVAVECNTPDVLRRNFITKDVKLEDHSDENISLYFEECTHFIREGIELGEGVLVHCRMGVSRSATIVMAYLMRFGGVNGVAGPMPYNDVFQHVKKCRPEVSPNFGFALALREYDVQLGFRNNVWDEVPTASNNSSTASSSPPNALSSKDGSPESGGFASSPLMGAFSNPSSAGATTVVGNSVELKSTQREQQVVLIRTTHTHTRLQLPSRVIAATSQSKSSVPSCFMEPHFSHDSNEADFCAPSVGYSDAGDEGGMMPNDQDATKTFHDDIVVAAPALASAVSVSC